MSVEEAPAHYQLY